MGRFGYQCRVRWIGQSPDCLMAIPNLVATHGIAYGATGSSVVASDPIPERADTLLRDLLRLCGQRRPAPDRNLPAPTPADIGTFLNLDLALQFMTDPIDTPPYEENAADG